MIMNVSRLLLSGKDFLEGAWWHTSSQRWEAGASEPLSSRMALFTEQVPRQPGLYQEILLQNRQTKQKTFYFSFHCDRQIVLLDIVDSCGLLEFELHHYNSFWC